MVLDQCHLLHGVERLDGQRRCERHDERDADRGGHIELRAHLYGCGRKRACHGRVDGDGTGTDRHHCSGADLYYGGTELDGDLVFDQCNFLYGEWFMERRGSDQRYVERNAKLQRHRDLCAGLHGCRWHSERHCGVDGERSAQQAWRRCDGALGAAGSVGAGCGRTSAAGSCRSLKANSWVRADDDRA